MNESRTGRPRASSCESLAEAACELFLERGYDATSVADITSRAGVSRSSFFNYFGSKDDIFWSTFDERLAAVGAALAAGVGLDAALLEVADTEPDSLALGIREAEAMGLTVEIERGRAIREHRLSGALARALRDRAGAVRAEIVGGAFAAAVFGAVWRWAVAPGRRPLGEVLREGLDAVPVDALLGD